MVRSAHSVPFDDHWDLAKEVFESLMIGKLKLVGPKTHSYLMVGPRLNLCTLGTVFSFVKLIKKKKLKRYSFVEKRFSDPILGGEEVG